LVFDGGASTACLVDPGFDVDLVVEADNRELHRWFVGRTTWAEARRAGDIRVLGSSRLARELPHWFHPTEFRPDVSRAARAEARAG
jgi:hypothetical protein